MAQYQEIRNYFKKFQEAQCKLEIVQKNKKELESLVSLEKIEQIQTAVQTRMGPFMCDNTQKQSNNQRAAFLQVLQDFKSEMEASNKSQQLQYKKMKDILSLERNRIQQAFELNQKSWSEQRQQLRSGCQQELSLQTSKQLSLISEAVYSNLEQQLLSMQHSLQVLLLQQQIRRKKQKDELLILAQR